MLIFSGRNENNLLPKKNGRMILLQIINNSSCASYIAIIVHAKGPQINLKLSNEAYSLFI